MYLKGYRFLLAAMKTNSFFHRGIFKTVQGLEGPAVTTDYRLGCMPFNGAKKKKQRCKLRSNLVKCLINFGEVRPLIQ